MSNQAYTSDLRGDAKEFNRDKNSRVKWQYGQSYGPGRRLEDDRPRPARVFPHTKYITLIMTPHAYANISIRSTHPGQMKARTSLNKDIVNASDESSADEEVEHPSAAPAPDAEIAYSYDAERGPSHGSQILKHALDKAIERHEGKETDKLIKNEYEVLGHDEDVMSPQPRKHNLSPEDEDYYFVEA